jgi:hypothetical protein
MVADIDPDPVLSATNVPSTVRCTPTLGQFPKCRCTECLEPGGRPVAKTWSWKESAAGVTTTCPLTASPTAISGKRSVVGAALAGATGAGIGLGGGTDAAAGEGDGDSVGGNGDGDGDATAVTELRVTTPAVLPHPERTTSARPRAA